jgi:predicted transposase/invertase (TIGR01784 family)
MSQDHDHSYKNLFSHVELIKDLLQGFIHEPWINELDFDTLERVNSHFVTDKLERREEDVIWRVKWRERYLYLYLLIAFQSTDDVYMALRVMVYVGLLYQYLIREKQIKKGELLPPVFPIVLYNGQTTWKSSLNVQDLIQSVTGFENYTPQLSYFLLDEQRYQPSGQWDELKNLVAAIFELEKSKTPQDIQKVVLRLLQWLNQPEQESLRRGFAKWLNYVLLPRRLHLLNVPLVHSLNEVNAMLAETVQGWYDEAEAKGAAIGEARGEARGQAIGEARGEIRGQRIVLIRQLKKRFGELSPSTQNKIDNATGEQLEQWALNVLDAHHLDDVFKIK